VSKEIGDNNTSSNFSAKFENTQGLHKDSFSLNDEIVIYSDKDATPTTVIFRGIVEDIEFDGSGDEKTRDTITISGRDYTARLQDIKIEPVVYNNIEISQIVLSLMTAVTDITTINVLTTSTIKTHISFNHISIFDALKQLASEIGWYFYVDNNKDLHFEPKNTISSGVLLNNTNTIKSNFKYVDREMANNIWVYGDKILTGWQNTFTANGGSIYQLDFRPSNTNVYIGSSTVPKYGGIFELNTGLTGSPIQYLVDYDQARIIFVSGTAANNIPTSGTSTIRIDYERKKQIVKYGIDRVSENDYGRKDKIIVDKNIIDPSLAYDRVKAELVEYSSPIIQGTVYINGIVDLIPGNTLLVDLPYVNQNNVSYEILQVQYKFNPKNNFSNNVVTVKLNKRIINILDTIKQLILDLKAQQGEEIFDSDESTRLEFVTGSIGLRVAEWNFMTKHIGNSFVIGHAINGKLGSPYIGVSGAQIVLGSLTAGALTKIRSGTYLDL